MGDWGIIKNEYITTQISTRDLAKKHGVSYSALEKRCRKDGWAAERGKVAANMRQKTVEAVSAAQADRVVELLNGGRKAAALLVGRLDQIAVTGEEVNAYEIRAITGALKNVRDLYGIDVGTDDIKFQKARELLGGVPDALDG